MPGKSVGKILDDKASSAIRKGGGSISEKEMIKIMMDAGKKSGLFKKMEMGGEVMDTTKSMPVGMMDGGKVKPMKMKMGGVIPGRGGMFKGIK